MKKTDFKLHLLLMVFILSLTTNVFAQRQSFDLGQDFLLANFDLKPDEDDVHAAAALGCMLVHPDLAGIKYHAVAGAFGRQNGTYINTATPGLYTTLFGTQNATNSGWSDLVNNRQGTLNRVRDMIAATIQGGNQVFVQEAGQSDFTYDVLQLVISDTPVTINQVRQNVIVVQHSWNPNGNLDFNERQTTPFKLTWVKDNTDYQQVANGNVANNGTPGYKNNNTNWLSEAKSNNNPNAQARRFWTDADAVCDNFNSSFENPTITQRGGVDYSDNVEIWWIFEIGSKGVTNNRTFWDRYVVNTPSGGGNNGGGNNNGNACSTSSNIGGLNATAVSNTSIDVSFTPLTGVNTYEVRTFADGTFNGALQGATQFDSGSASPIRVDGLTAGTSYTFAIRALCTAGGTSPLASVNGTTNGGSTGGGNNGGGNNGGGTTGDCDFEESNGLVVIEAENLPIGNGPWEARTSTTGFTGAGHIFYNGADRFGGGGAGAEGVLSVKIQINTTGKYQFQFRSAAGIGTQTTEHNDTWLRFADATDFYGEKPNGQRTYPRGETRARTPNPEGASGNGYFKLYVNSLNWSFTTSTGDNADGRNVFVEFDSPGLYTMELAGRSNGHVIDRIVLHRNANDPLNLNNGQTNCNGGGTTPPPPPPTTTGIAIPGTIQTEVFAAKNGDVRQVDVQGSTTVKALGFIRNNNYTDYDINVANAGTYKLDAFTSSNGVGGNIVVSIVNGANNLGTIAVPTNNSWNNYSNSQSANVDLAAGNQRIRFTYTGPGGFLFNVERVEFSAVAAPPPPPATGTCTGGNITGLTSTGNTNTSVALSWTALSGASSYEIRTFAAGTFNGNVTGATGFASSNQASANITGLTAGTDYTFAIRALCTGGNPSALASVNASTSGGSSNQVAGSYDFGTANSPLQSSYTRITPTSSNWTNTAGLDSRDRTSGPGSLPNNLNRDFIFSAQTRIFEHTTGNGTYDVTVTLGDRGYARTGQAIKAEGTTVISGFDTAVNQFRNATFQTTVNDGKLSLEFSIPSGVWCVTRVVITPAGSAKSLGSDLGITINVNPVSNGTLELSGANDASYSISSITGNVVSTGTISNNTVDVSNLSSGIYIAQFEKGGSLQIEKIVID